MVAAARSGPALALLRSCEAQPGYAHDGGGLGHRSILEAPWSTRGTVARAFHRARFQLSINPYPQNVQKEIIR